jgi:hypothetical protein
VEHHLSSRVSEQGLLRMDNHLTPNSKTNCGVMELVGVTSLIGQIGLELNFSQLEN